MAGSAAASGGCPVDHTQRQEPTCPVDHTPTEESKCPVDHSASLSAFLPQGPELDPHNNMPLTPEQRAHPTQQQLSTHRTVSSIPRASRYQQSECPTVDAQSDNWVYPSEQMFFNAMKRKQWAPREQDMKTVVPIHNIVNEMCWSQILEWERMHEGCLQPKLLKFEGKAKQPSPKARVRAMIGYQMPFDRHDWTVDRCGKQVRYVIDFYQGKRDPANPDKPSFFVDVRPALTVEGAWDRTRRFLGI